MTDDILDRAADAALALAADQPWPTVSLRDIAVKAEISFPDLYAKASSRLAVLARVSERFDRAALAIDYPQGSNAQDRLFDAVMARLEAMEPHRTALLNIAKAQGGVVAATRFPFIARALLEAAGVPATPPRLLAMAVVWGRVVQVWREDDAALNRTMAELDKRLKQMAQRLGMIGAGL
ncbi:TetR family transcriptional regulator [Caulobacter segnis]|uniref:TetR family transcriptional regulator n=1 Tax=Caulobacter segnis TaxID=88688 RepID=A0A2W5WVB7_9CAUL|nr:TetR family transcriptional regulator [Caulobacter segnis]PZR31914.1 MAG: TetR family transcriptional regulator [Caulobacter segnis]